MGALVLPWAPLAHAGPGSTWQAMVVVGSLALAVAVVLAVTGVLHVDAPDDLLLPLAGSAIAASLGPLGHAWLSDWIGWALPIGAVSLIALLLAALAPIELGLRSPLPYAALVVAAAGVWALWQPLTLALHPPLELLPLSDDGEVVIVAPSDGEVVAPGEVWVSVEVTGGSIGPGGVPLDELPADPEEAGELKVTIDGTRVDVEFEQRCTVAEPCSAVSFPVQVEPGEQVLTVELTRGDGTPLAPFVADRVTITAR